MKSCQKCGNENSENAKFCGKCGTPTAAPTQAAPVAPAEPKEPPKKRKIGTVMGLPMLAPMGAKTDGVPISPSAKGDVPSKTMVDADPPAATAPTPAPIQQPIKARNPAKSANRTMLGMTAPAVLKKPVNSNPATAKPAKPATATPAAELAPPPAQHDAPKIMSSSGTVQGTGAPMNAPAKNAPKQANKPLVAQSNRTMLGVGMQASSSESGEYEEVMVPKKRSPLIWVMIGLFAVLTLVGLGVGAYFLFLKSGSNIKATVTHTDEGETLSLHLPDAPPGTKIRFGSTEKELKDNKAEFALTASDLTLGENELSVGVISNDEVSDETVLIDLSYRIRPDLSALNESPATLRILVDAQPGAKVSIEGEALTLDASGKGKKDFPLSGSESGGTLDRTIKYSITPTEGEAETGSVHAVIPVTSMRIDRPGNSIVTDKKSIEIAGLIPKGATLTIDGNTIEAKPDGNFTYDFPLERAAEFKPTLTARETGKVPRSMTLTIRRVEDIKKEAAAFDYDKALTYKRLAEAPASQKGNNASFIGRIYNVDVHKGQSVLQILVSDCAKDKRCPLWINYAAATDYSTKDWVQVFGTTAGEQQFRAASGELKSVPSINAVYILPYNPSAKKKRAKRRR